MRVISGTARGRHLKELQGMETRPTTDRVKEALFNIVQFELPGRQVLDLFAGRASWASRPCPGGRPGVPLWISGVMRRPWYGRT